MATQRDVRQIVRALPATTEAPDRFAFSVANKAILWVWMERVDPKRARVPNPDVIAVHVANELEKDALIDLDPGVFFTEPHYDGFPAVLVRLPAIDLDMLTRVITDAWRIRAPKRLLRELGDEAP